MSYKLLVAEDEDVIRRGLIYSMNWRALDCSEPLEAGDGEEAVQKILEHRPDIVILDINMPVLGGLQVLESTQEQCGYAPIILSGYADFEFAQTAMRYGVSSYLLKPVDFGRLGEAIESANVERQRTAMFRQTLAKQDELRQVDLLAQLRDARVKNEAVRAMLEYVEGHYAEKITVCDLARLLCYSDTFLTRKFKEVVGINFNDYLNRLRIQKAIGLLLHSGKRVQQIGEECGFHDYKYFNTVFRKYLGCSAGEFLKYIK